MHPFLDKKQILKKRQTIRNVLVFCLFFIFASIGIFSHGAQFLNYIGLPLWQTKKAISNGVDSIGYMALTKQAVFHKNEILFQENKDLKNRMIDYSILEAENNHLKELLGRIPEKNSFILANILTKPNNSPYDTIIIDTGNDNGLKEGSLVYADEKIPVGVVSSVYSNTSLVSLYSNPGTITDAVMDGSNVNVELTGRGGGNFEMIVAKDLNLVVGGTVVIPGTNSAVLAIIDAVISSPSDPNQKVILHSPVNIQQQKWVLVKNKK